MANKPCIPRYKQADPFYLSRAWQMARREALQRDAYWCQRCKRRTATMVHHIIPREICPERELDLDNLQSLCNGCHAILHPEKGEKTRKHKKGGEETDGIRIYVPSKREVRV